MYILKNIVEYIRNNPERTLAFFVIYLIVSAINR